MTRAGRHAFTRQQDGLHISQGPHRLVVRTSRCGRDIPGSTPGGDICAQYCPAGTSLRNKVNVVHEQQRQLSSKCSYQCFALIPKRICCNRVLGSTMAPYTKNDCILLRCARNSDNRVDLLHAHLVIHGGISQEAGDFLHVDTRCAPAELKNRQRGDSSPCRQSPMDF